MARTSAPQAIASPTRNRFEPTSPGRRSSTQVIHDAIQWDARNHTVMPAVRPAMTAKTYNYEIPSAGIRLTIIDHAFESTRSWRGVKSHIISPRRVGTVSLTLTQQTPPFFN